MKKLRDMTDDELVAEGTKAIREENKGLIKKIKRKLVRRQQQRDEIRS